jgi:hypothetical protein
MRHICSDSDYVPLVTPQDVLRIVNRDFPEDERAGVLLTLKGYGTEAWHRERERVCAAVLKLSAGNAANVRTYVEIAKVDYREVVGPAEEQDFFKDITRLMSDREHEQTRRDKLAHYLDWLNRPS